jgi:predicted nucleotidyltransferase
MSRNEIISILKEYKKHTAEQYGIQELGIFGSVARDEVREDSDVDVVVKFDTPNLITMSHIRQDIEEALHKHVDIIHYRERMNKVLKQRIDQEAYYV